MTALHWYHRGHGFDSCSRLNILQALISELLIRDAQVLNDTLIRYPWSTSQSGSRSIQGWHSVDTWSTAGQQSAMVDRLMHIDWKLAASCPTDDQMSIECWSIVSMECINRVSTGDAFSTYDPCYLPEVWYTTRSAYSSTCHDNDILAFVFLYEIHNVLYWIYSIRAQCSNMAGFWLPGRCALRARWWRRIWGYRELSKGWN